MTSTVRALLVTALVTLAFLAWIGFSSDWREVWSLLQAANMPLLLIAALFSLPVQWLRARRFKLMLNLSHEKDWPVFRVAGLLVIFNTLVPFRLGELSFPYLANKAFGTGKAYAIGVLTFVRLFDLALVLLLLALFANMTLPEALFRTLIFMIVAAALVALTGLLFFARAIPGLVLRVTGRGKISTMVNNAADGAAALGQGHRLVFVGYSLAIWLLLGGMAFLAGMAVIPSLCISHGYFAAAASNIAFALPVSGFASLGPAQVAWAEALRFNGYAYPLAIASALAVHLTVLLGIALTALLIGIRR